MRNIYKLVILGVALTAFSFSGMAQYRNYHLQEIESIDFDNHGDPISGSNSGTLRPPTTEDNPFKFDIRFNDVNILLRLEAARRQAAAAKFNKWLSEQRSVLLKEINKQLGKNHTNFNTAKNDYFRNYEKNRLKIENRASSEAWKLTNKAKKLEIEQKAFTTELYFIKKWQTLRSWCGVHNSGTCYPLSETKIRGTRLGSTSTSSLNQLYNQSLSDFSNREFQSAQNTRWSTGIRRIINDHSLLNTVVNNRIAHFDGLYLDEQVYLMINYLSTYYYTPAPIIQGLPNPDYQLPSLWNNGTILALGKRRAPSLSQEAQLFQPGYIEGHAGPCSNPEWQDWIGAGDCDQILDALYELRDDVIQRHIDRFKPKPLSIINNISKPCAASIVDEIGNLDFGLQLTIKQMFGAEDSKYNLTYRNVDEIKIELQEGKAAAAETDWTVDSKGNITSIEIKLVNGYLENATDVSIFTTLLHESMHAAMLYQLDSVGVPLNEDSTNYTILVAIWSRYIAGIRRGEDGNKNLIGHYQHEVMSELIEKMAPLIKQFANSKGYDMDDFEAEVIAWSGLQLTDIYRDLPEDISESYDAIIEDENQGFEILSIGKKCNDN